jgi:gamma-D-glutamyl-L-lysine dipeptidyl-peptidase
MEGERVITAGNQATVAVSVATLWRSPDRVRPVDKPASETPPDVRAWATAMTETEQIDLLGRTDSQLLLGERVAVDEVAGDWARVIALGQASSKDPRGYPGWMPTGHLAPTRSEAAPTHLVSAVTTSLRNRAAGEVIIGDVIVGTALSVIQPGIDGWLPVTVAGRAEPLWVRGQDVVSLPVDRADPVAVAAALLGTRYVWGGLSAFGIDCSGLVHLSHRRIGVTLPRDASDQALATASIAFGEEKRGDLYFFARPGKTIHHVGLVTTAPDADGTRHMVHASGGGVGVVEQPVHGERLETLVSVHRVS